ncbi:hypothetical protein U1Q18_006445, partial [Sarracenia purpurea var. burkii]
QRARDDDDREQRRLLSMERQRWCAAAVEQWRRPNGGLWRCPNGGLWRRAEKCVDTRRAQRARCVGWRREWSAAHKEQEKM